MYRLVGLPLRKPQESLSVANPFQWFFRQCEENFFQWIVGILLAFMTGAVSFGIAAGAWCYAIHDEVSGMRRDLSHIVETLADHKGVLSSHSAELTNVGQRVSRIEGRSESQNKN